jgi:hypothetical protein
MSIPPDQILEDIRAVAAILRIPTLSFSQYKARGKYSRPTFDRNFGSWAKAARAAGLTAAHEPSPKTTDELCFQAIEAAWRRMGRQPREIDVRKAEYGLAGQTITRRFGGSWRKALGAFVAYMNAAGEADSPEVNGGSGAGQSSSLAAEQAQGPKHRTARDPGWRLRFLVMRRDSFRCRLCGGSPATDPRTKLVIDHVVPWSHGGETVYENLQTLCEKCNGGRSNLGLGEPREGCGLPSDA